jgi:hypothetical protein
MSADIVTRTRELLDARRRGMRRAACRALRPARQEPERHRIHDAQGEGREKDEFERGLQRYYAVRSVFSQLTNNLYSHLGMDALRDETRRTREPCWRRFHEEPARRDEELLPHVRANPGKSAGEIAEITKMMEAMYERFSTEHGMKLAAPAPFSLLRYEKEIDRLEKASTPTSTRCSTW